MKRLWHTQQEKPRDGYVLGDINGRRVGCMVCPFSPTKQLIFVFNEFPNLKKKMLKTIHLLRETSNYASEYKDKTDEELLEWWMSKKNMAEYFQPRLF